MDYSAETGYFKGIQINKCHGLAADFKRFKIIGIRNTIKMFDVRLNIWFNFMSCIKSNIFKRSSELRSRLPCAESKMNKRSQERRCELYFEPEEKIWWASPREKCPGSVFKKKNNVGTKSGNNLYEDNDLVTLYYFIVLGRAPFINKRKAKHFSFYNRVKNWYYYDNDITFTMFLYFLNFTLKLSFHCAHFYK